MRDEFGEFLATYSRYMDRAITYDELLKYMAEKYGRVLRTTEISSRVEIIEYDNKWYCSICGMGYKVWKAVRHHTRNGQTVGTEEQMCSSLCQKCDADHQSVRAAGGRHPLPMAVVGGYPTIWKRLWRALHGFFWTA